MNFPLFDSHCHLQYPDLKNNLEEVLLRAKEAGVLEMLCCGTEESDWPLVQELARIHPQIIIPSFGLHPWYIKNRSTVWLKNLEDFLKTMPSAVGEIGLDHSLADFNEQEQNSVFISQLELANQLQRPVTIHCRKAWESLLKILKAIVPHCGGMIHSYSGSAELIPALEDYGLYLSFSGSVTRSGNKRGRKAIGTVSPERLLIETDSPDLLPAGLPDGTNEPANLIHVLKEGAALLHLREEEFALRTRENTKRFLKDIVHESL